MPLLLKLLIVAFTFSSLTTGALADESRCFGTASDGRLENGVELPAEGKNFIAYGTLPVMLGRTYVHGRVRDTVVDAYEILEKELPGKVFKYAETGFREGGEFRPHKTHRNGLSVDFMVPVLDEKGRSVHLPTHAFNKYGYTIEFDGNGVYEGYRIDFEALGAHIEALSRAAQRNGISLRRVIFDPQLQPHLYQSRHGAFIKTNIEMPDKRSWVRHDEHYHVDFNVECGPMKD